MEAGGDNFNKTEASSAREGLGICLVTCPESLTVKGDSRKKLLRHVILILICEGYTGVNHLQKV